MADPAHPRRRTFGPVVLLGVAAGALAAYAGSRTWVRGTGTTDLPDVAGGASAAGSSPLTTALAFVVLACWGVVLVTRGRFRRAVALLAVLGALGVAVSVAWAPFSLPDHVRSRALRDTGVALEGTSLTAWWVVAAGAAVLALVTTGACARWVRHWPEMGAKYDNPTAGPAQDGTDEPVPSENIDIWKALDEGRDPTA
ncbi:putative membrane protein (TIGR02234 family) [Nocardioides cavernae]|uniref:Putative membrane protein (TIGR02234 family) n=1 Tax=Nocardioides cavernae TaxID=1921566 RepID=A0A7Y9KRH5_9ACTN|nr:Trp biosynthesis-associated membrane protein [Nocardioides cavernae]NYE38771.1 putative membrane protein (TIGR02234 family) [Nocardioides cavernae]